VGGVTTRSLSPFTVMYLWLCWLKEATLCLTSWWLHALLIFSTAKV